jgi:hypothetical protein
LKRRVQAFNEGGVDAVEFTLTAGNQPIAALAAAMDDPARDAGQMAARRTWAKSLSTKPVSRCALASPYRNGRAKTLMAVAIQTLSCWVLTHNSSACT